MSDKMKGAMAAVLDDMGRAAREGRARRFSGSGKKPRAVDVTMGEVTLEPNGAALDVEVDPVKEAGMSPEEMAELQRTLDTQR